MTSFIIGFALVMTYSFLQSITTGFDLMIGEFPIIVRVVCVFLLGAFYYSYCTSTKGNIFENLNVFRKTVEEEVVQPETVNKKKITTSVKNNVIRESPVKKHAMKVPVAQEEKSTPKQEPIKNVKAVSLDEDLFAQLGSEDMDDLYRSISSIEVDSSTEIESTSTLFEDDSVLDVDLINADLLDNLQVNSFQNRVSEGVKSSIQANLLHTTVIPYDQLKEIQAKVDSSTDPSKYLNESLLSIVNEALSDDIFGTIEYLDSSSVPKSFQMLA